MPFLEWFSMPDCASVFVANVYLGSKLVHGNVPLRGRTTIGRGSENSLVVTDASISRCHLSVEVLEAGEGCRLVARDEGSTNGTFVGGKRIQEKELGPGDDIVLGRCRIEIRAVNRRVFPDLRDDQTQSVVFEGDPFADPEKPSRRLQALYELGLDLSDLEVPLVLERTAATLQRCLDLDHLAILLEGRQGLLLCTCWDRTGPCAREEVVVSRTMIRNCLETGRPVLSANVEMDERFSRARSLVFRQVASALCAPLRGGTSILGVVYCTTRNPFKRFDRDDLQFLTLVASYLGVALSHKRALSQVCLEAAKLEAVLESLSEGILVCDGDFVVVSANRAAREILQVPGLVGRPLAEAFKDFAHTFDPVTAPLTRRFELERKKSGHFSYKIEGFQSFQATLSSAKHLEREGWRHIICLRDETQKRRSEKMKSILVSQLAHKLRTPLTILNGVTALIAEQLGANLDDEMRSLLGMSEESSRQISELVQRFEEFNAFGLHHALGARYTLSPLESLLEQAITACRSDIEKHGLQVHSKVEAGRYRLSADRDRIVQCFVQLIQNAAKFAGDEAHLEIEAAAGRDGLKVRFRDSGPGIPVGELEEVFGIFHQVDLENTGEVPGVGLGLWWTREVVRAHGGDVHLLSPGEGGAPGACVEIFFPGRLVVVTPRAAPEEAGLGNVRDESYDDALETIAIQLYDAVEGKD